MVTKVDCPGDDELRRLANHGGEPEEIDRLARHLEACEPCGLALETMLGANDTLGALRASSGVAMPSGPEIEKAKEKVRKLQPAAMRALQNPATIGTKTAFSASNFSAKSGTATEARFDYLGSPEQADELGRLGQYRILKKLGSGGMGIVFLAEDAALDRKVALKTLLPKIAEDATACERFLREARSAASIEHEHIVIIYHVGMDRGLPFIAMPLLKGESLEDRLRKKPAIPLRQALIIARQIAAGLQAAHVKGLIHRDIKPGNVWLDSDTKKVKILDFGLARAATDTAHLTQSGAIVGTPAYMAPEQARGAPVDGRADLFALGCVLYEMLIGRRPFTGKDTMSILTSLALDTPTPPTELDAAIPAGVSDIAMKLLAKNPDDRYATAAEAAAALRGCVAPGGSPPATAKPAEVRIMVAAPVKPTVIRTSPDQFAAIKPAGAATQAIPSRPVKRRGPMAIVAALAATAIVAAGVVVGVISFRANPQPKDDRANLHPPAKLPIAPPVVLADREKPFVLVRDRKSVGEFKSFPATLGQFISGDTIEIHGNGPFSMPAITLDRISIIAGKGYRPRIEVAESVPLSGYWIQVTNGPARFEGCDFLGTRSPLSMMWLRGQCDISRCRLVKISSNSDSLLSVIGGRTRVTDSMLICGFSHGTIGINPEADLEMENCLYFNESYVFFTIHTGGQKLSLKNNTLVGVSSVLSLFDKIDAPLKMQAENNVFASPSEQSFIQSAGEKDLTKLIQWNGVDNVFASSTPYQLLRADNERMTTLAEWSALWGKNDRGSRETRGLPASFQTYWRLPCEEGVRDVRRSIESRRPASLPDVGPTDFDLIGPGDAYQKVLANRSGKPLTPGELRPEAIDGGPVTLIRQGKVLRGFAELGPAAEAAEDGDVIEIRTDRELTSFSRIGAAGRKLTVRAAPGYRPVIPGFWLASTDVWTIEGIRFRDDLNRIEAAGEMRLVNCSIDASPQWLANSSRVYLTGAGRGKTVVIENCHLPAGIVIVGPNPEQSVRFVNSILGSVGSSVPDARVTFDHCAFWSPGLGNNCVDTINQTSTLTVDSRSTWYESVRQCRVNKAGQITWTGDRNVFTVDINGWLWPVVEGATAPLNLRDWRTLWKSDAKSVAVSPLIHDPTAWRIDPGVLGAPPVKAGADVDRVLNGR